MCRYETVNISLGFDGIAALIFDSNGITPWWLHVFYQAACQKVLCVEYILLGVTKKVLFQVHAMHTQ
jgi:hypothetical protein